MSMIAEWLKKLVYIHAMDYYSKNEIIDTYDNLDGSPGHDPEWRKNAKDDMLYASIYITF